MRQKPSLLFILTFSFILAAHPAGAILNGRPRPVPANNVGRGRLDISGIGSIGYPRILPFPDSAASDAYYQNVGQYLIELDPVTLQIKNPNNLWEIGAGIGNNLSRGTAAWELSSAGPATDPVISFLQTNSMPRFLGGASVYHIDLDTGRLTRQFNLQSGAYRGLAQKGDTFYLSYGKTIWGPNGDSITLSEDIDALDFVSDSTNGYDFLLAVTQNSAACKIWEIPLDDLGNFEGEYNLITTVPFGESGLTMSSGSYTGISYAKIPWEGALKEVLYLSKNDVDSDSSDEVVILDFHTGEVLQRVLSEESSLLLEEPIKLPNGKSVESLSWANPQGIQFLDGRLFILGDYYWTFWCPSISIEKSISVDGGTTFVDADSTPGPTVVAGSDLYFKLVITNTGLFRLTDIHLSDSDYSVSGCSIPSSLAPRNSFDCVIGPIKAGSGQQVNSSKVTAKLFRMSIRSFSDTDDAHYFGINPAIRITKTPTTQQVLSSGTATFTITVTNTGDVALSNVKVTDPMATGCAQTIGTMAAGTSHTYTCSRTSVTTSFTNTATATGTPPAGPNVTATASAQVTVIHPGISITKTPATQNVTAPDTTAEFTITVTNTGDVPLTNVTVADPLAPDCAETIVTLAAGSMQTYDCSLTPVAASFTNTATVIGTTPIGSTVNDSDTAQVTVP